MDCCCFTQPGDQRPKPLLREVSPGDYRARRLLGSASTWLCRLAFTGMAGTPLVGSAMWLLVSWVPAMSIQESRLMRSAGLSSVRLGLRGSYLLRCPVSLSRFPRLAFTSTSV